MSGAILSLTRALSWESLRSLPLVALLFVAIAVGVAILYLAQTRRLPRHWRVLLPTLRLAALLALVVSILRPVITRPPKPGEQGAIVILVDHSHSMAINDRQRSHPQLVALADGLGRLPPGARARGDELIASVRTVQSLLDEVSRADSELTFAQISGRDSTDAAARRAIAVRQFDASAASLAQRRSTVDPKSSLAAALDKLQKQLQRKPNESPTYAWIQSVGAALAEVAAAAGQFQSAADEALYNNNPQARAISEELRGLSRFGLVEHAIARPAVGLLANLPAGIRAYGFAVGAGIAPLPLNGPSDRPVRRLLLNTESPGMDLSSAVRAALDRLQGVSVEAVVLFSDGRQPAANRSTRPAAITVPVYAVAVAPAADSRDLSLADISVPDGVYAGEPFTISARVHGHGDLAGATVDLHCAVGSPIATFGPSTRPDAIPPQHVTLTNGQSPELKFELKIDEPGVQRVALRLPNLTNEITVENNVIERWIKVYPRKQRVMILSSAPTWDQRYLRNALAARAGIELHVEQLNESSSTLAPQHIADQDVLVLFDLAAGSLDAAQWSAARQMTEHGGLLILVAGPNYVPTEYAAPPLADLLPYPPPSTAATHLTSQAATWHTWLGDEPIYHFVPAADPARILRLADGAAADQQAWASLPPLFGYLSLPALRPRAKALLRERESGQPVIAMMPLSSGHVVLVGLDETWRWRFKSSQNAHEQIWTQLLTELAEPPYAVTAGALSLDIDKAAIAPGASARVRLKDLAPSPSSAAAPITLHIMRDAEVVRTESLNTTDGAHYTTTINALPAGNYVVEAQSGTSIARYPLRVVGQYESELENASGDRAALQAIADVSGGQLLTLEQLRRLPALLAAAASEPQPVQFPLWHSTYLFVFVVACFAAEWATRKRLGLA